MQIGFSLFWQLILGADEPNRPDVWQIAAPDMDQTLSDFRELGINSIELKLTEEMELPLVFQAIAKLIGLGFQITFHAPARFQCSDGYQFNIISAITKYMNRQFCIMPLWVLHPLHSKTQPRTAIYARTLSYLQQILALPAASSAAFALENLRNRADSDKTHIGDSYAEILNIIAQCDGQLGICWDFGHANAMFQRGLQEKFPPPEFLDKVIHCHIHDCLNQKTHLPLGMGEVPIDKNIALLVDHGYDGILNLELSPHKIDDPENFLNYVEQSVGLLKRFIGQD